VSDPWLDDAVPVAVLGVPAGLTAVTRDDGRALSDRFSAAGVRTRHCGYEDIIHGLLTMLSEPKLDRARKAVQEIGDVLGGEFV